MKYVKIFLKVLVCCIVAFFVFTPSFSKVETIEDLTEYIESNPDDYTGYNGRANLYKSFGVYKQAIQDYDVAIDLDSFDAATYNYRGEAYKALGDEENAQKDFNSAKKIESE